MNDINILLSVQDLKVDFYGNERVARVLDGVSFEVGKGETVCLVGESGCGKTVSAMTILGIIPQPPGEIVSGQILFKGQDLLDLKEDEIQQIRGKHIAMVFQEPMTSLNPVFTIGDQIQEVIVVHEKVDEREIEERCIRLLKDVGIPSPDERLKDYPHQLSGGQAQRVVLARALALNPSFIILDEPTSALDVSVQAQIINLLVKLQKEHNLSYMFISHDLSLVQHIGTRIGVIYLGEIVELASNAALFNSPQHPYTQALLSATPVPDPGAKRHRIVLEGNVPSPANPPAGCRFHIRCPQVMDICRSQPPSVHQTRSGWAKCHLLEK